MKFIANLTWMRKVFDIESKIPAQGSFFLLKKCQLFDQRIKGKLVLEITNNFEEEQNLNNMSASMKWFLKTI